MRIKISCELSGTEVPLDYRRRVLRTMKTGLSDQSPEIFKMLFEENTKKDYTFSVFLPNPVFSKEKIDISSPQLTIYFSTANAELALHFYNAFMGLKKKVLPWSDQLDVTIQKIDLIHQPKIVSKEIVLKALSPIVCRDHNRETRKDWFLVAGDEGFEEVLKRNMVGQLEPVFGENIKYSIENLELVPEKARKTVVQFYDKQIACSIGIFRLTGEPFLLNHLLQSGIGSLTGSGFGYVDVISSF